MMMSPKASRLAGDLGALVPDVNRYRLFTFDGRALGVGEGPATSAARSGPSGCVTQSRSLRCPDRRTQAADVKGTAIWRP
jgi:hypothetical protein